MSWREIVTPPPLISHSTRYATPQLVRDFHSSAHFRSKHNNILFQVPISLDRGEASTYDFTSPKTEQISGAILKQRHQLGISSKSFPQ